MKRFPAHVRVGVLLALAACGDNHAGPGPGSGSNPPPPGPPALVYTDPTGGALRLVKNARSTADHVVLDFIVGDAALTGFATGFDLPLAPGKVSLGPFTPGTALAAGQDPIAASAVIPAAGPLAHTLVIGQSQKADGAGAVAADTALAPHAVLFTVELAATPPLTPGVIFDGTAAGFALPSGGLRTRAGLTVVAPADVKIGKLEIR
ncbi:MAG TPA: hypothetical protein VFP84_03395 [Kofleriaceae bacterium]|nr:hypothetical protein [Kofleriaceae bacterium]